MGGFRKILFNKIRFTIVPDLTSAYQIHTIPDKLRIRNIPIRCPFVYTLPKIPNGKNIRLLRCYDVWKKRAPSVTARRAGQRTGNHLTSPMRENDLKNRQTSPMKENDLKSPLQHPPQFFPLLRLDNGIIQYIPVLESSKQ